MMDFPLVRDERTGEETLEVSLTGTALLRQPLFNKGSSFPEDERRDFGLLGLLPPHVNTLDSQAARRYREYLHQHTDLDKHILLRALQDRNEVLFYRLLSDHVAEMMPIIYTPTVGDACRHFSHIYRQARGLFIPYTHRHDLDAILDNRPFREVDVIVVTDGERILGLGDQGVDGMGIPVGKLSLYTLCGGIHPARTLPVLLDPGTDNADKLADPLYLGWRHGRVRGPEYDDFVESFVQAVRRKLPGVLLQWEDFAQANARRLLDRYRDRLCTFNDDIQGTGAVALAAVLAALRVTGGRLRDQCAVVVGAGSAGLGIAEQLAAAMARDGLPEAEARARFWLVDKPGLLLADMPGLLPGQQKFAQPPERVAGWRRDAPLPSPPVAGGEGKGEGGIGLLEVVANVRPTVLLGVSGQPGVFTQAVVREMARHVERPIILPLSNPTSRAEAAPADLIAWTDGRALVATGSPFPDVTWRGRTFRIGQCNNSYVFPGVGLGVIASRARRVSDEMFFRAAETLSASAADGTAPGGSLFPPLEEVRQVSRRIALAVGAEAMRQGLAPPLSPEEWQRRVDATMWTPRYPRFKRRPGEPAA
ncbi:MAG TPA: NAD-dependent malic enzyme [Gemmataceae bacterium]|nr:NAD-dependent malic enzyme [Gemmataceae bacterium]